MKKLLTIILATSTLFSAHAEKDAASLIREAISADKSIHHKAISIVEKIRRAQEMDMIMYPEDNALRQKVAKRLIHSAKGMISYRNNSLVREIFYNAETIFPENYLAQHSLIAYSLKQLAKPYSK